MKNTPAPLVILMLCFGAPSYCARHSDTAAINKFIASQESREKGRHAEGFTSVLRGDLNHDGIPDIAVLYTLEGQNGTNNYVQYLAVFLRLDGRLDHAADTPVGGKNYRELKIVSIKENMIFCNTISYAEKDPSCCPSIKGSTQYLLSGKKLEEAHRK